MSICICPKTDGGPSSLQQKKKVEQFLRNLGWPDISLGETEWSLYTIRQMGEAGNTVEDIQQVVPFRGGPCVRTLQCCSVCTRVCHTRCIQDCMTRLYMWQQIFKNTPKEERDKLPLNIRMISVQKFESWQHLSDTVGEMISKKNNPSLRGYTYATHPQKLSYEPAFEIDEHSGRPKSDPTTGEYKIIKWPKSGLCPYCLPSTTVDGYVLRELRKKERKEYAAVRGELHL